MISSTCSGAVAELLERGRDGLVDDLEEALADELLVLDEGDVRLDPGGIAIHHEGDRAGRRQDGDLGVPVAVLPAQLEGLVIDETRRLEQVGRDTVLRDRVGGVTVLADDPQEGLLVLLVLAERAAVIARDDRALAVRLAVHDRGQRGGVVAALLRVVGQATAHEQGAEVGVAEPERPEAVAVLLDPRRRVGRVVDEDLLGGDRQLGRVAVGLDVELAVLADELHQVEAGQVAVVGDQPLGDERVGDRLGHVVDGLDAVGDDRLDRRGARVAEPAGVRMGKDRVGPGLLVG